MSLYPSLEDLQIDRLTKAQEHVERGYSQMYVTTPQQPALPYPAAPSNCPSLDRHWDASPIVSNATCPLPYPVTPGHSMYPQLSEYMGLELTPALIAEHMPNSVAVQSLQKDVCLPQGGMVAPLSSLTPGLQRAQVTHGIRELILCKDGKGQVGLRVAAISKGVFVCLVMKGSPAALAGLRFGDQLLQINGQVLAGYTRDQVHDIFKKSSVNGISVIVRDRPFERTVTLHKDSLGHLGFDFKNGEIIRLVKDSSAARNGLLTEHHLLEVDGQNVVGLKDKEITALITAAPATVTCTVIPSFVYNHIMKKMASSLVKASMDHSVPTL